MAAVDELVQIFEHRIGPRNGAKVVARAWVDESYKKRLLTDGTDAIAELGFVGLQGECMVVLETRRRSIMPSFAHYARVIHGRRWGYLRVGTSRRPIAVVW